MITKYIFEVIRDFYMANREFFDSLMYYIGLIALDIFALLFLALYIYGVGLFVKREILEIKHKSDDE